MDVIAHNGYVFSFEGDVPEQLSASPGSRLSVSRLHCRDGEQSLRWDYRPGDRLIVRARIGYRPYVSNTRDQAISTFGLWIYSEQPMSGRLQFIFGRGEREDCAFSCGLQFRGWRTARVAYARDMEGAPAEDMDTLTILAPEEEEGTLFLDQIISCAPVDPRHHTRDEQVPFVNMGADEAANSHWLALLRMDRALRSRLAEEMARPYVAAAGSQVAAASRSAASEREALETMKERWDEWLLDKYRDKSHSLAQLEAFYLALCIQRRHDGLTGRTIDVVHVKDFYPSSELKRLLALNDAADLRQVTNFLLELAVTYRQSGDAELKAKLGRWFIDTMDHLEDQGWAWGSSQGTVHHLGYNLTGLYPASYMMREELREAGKLERTQRALRWYSGLGRICLPDEETEGNADIFNTTLTGMICSLLLIEEEDKAFILMKRMKRWLDLSCLPARGLRAMFKPDGAAYHHVNHYPAYALGGLQGLAPIVRLLAGTPFGLSVPAHETIRKALLAMRFYSNKREWLLAISGRHPTGKWALDPEVYAEMALAAVPGGDSDIDRVMAAAYLRLLQPGEETETSRYVRDRGVAAESDPVGHWTMNFACAAYHRRGNWLAGVRGFSRYVWGNETYVNCNLYGRYIAYGHLQILGGGDPVNHRESGFVPEGWNWNRWPGTTAKHLPYEELRADVRNVDRFSGFEEMTLSDESFAGGTSLDGADGVFAMKLHEHGKYDGSHRARKSYFFFDRLIVALGSDIENDDGEHATETTLFQHALKRQSDPTVIGGEDEVCAFPMQTVRETGDACWLMDDCGNGYYVPAGQTLGLSRTRQTSPHQKDDSPTEGDFATAWLSHGAAPSGGRYEYAVVVQSDPAGMARMAESISSAATAPYSVLRHDREAHIVTDRRSGTTGYVLFEKTENLGAGLLLGGDTPCIVMLRECDGSGLKLSVADPDLRLYEGVEADQLEEDGSQREVSLYSREWVHHDGAVHELQLYLEGIWQLEPGHEQLRLQHKPEENVTIVYVSCKDAIPVEALLNRSRT
ncbi:chondroitinase family polysaccharide lyase [Paenibacillus sp. J5C_2022]|uniref:chondroitinase family polysaccharide lyase n=1 Tax=Paenibacillus sp. J5C2022 TaxID=2977129 RepID=UPI0021D2C91C|nr:chondroitinase family polysaccharide lyase [Paenibacillus sp. J5C2022]MCU6712711.1 chondroitinase family polysaccharide lyase [Paenibacillus sp. J5C2022]